MNKLNWYVSFISFNGIIICNMYTVPYLDMLQVIMFFFYLLTIDKP